MHTATVANGRGLWAPFTAAQVFASGEPIQMQEVRADLEHSLPAATLTTPFRWSLGDGTTASGYAIRHRYAHPGHYQISVYAYEQRARRWFAFDSAILRIVPAGELQRDNIEFEALRVLLTLSSITWPLQAVLVLTVVAILVHLQYRQNLLRDARMPEERGCPPL